MSALPPLDDAHGVAPAEPNFFDDRPQRLRLHHLFVLTAVMAVLLAIQGPQRDYFTGNYQPPPALRMLWLVVGIAHTILSAAALTVLGYGIVGHRRGLRFFDQPGHWLVVEISLTALFGIVPGIGYRLLLGNFGSPKQPTMGDHQMQILMILMGYSVLVLVLGRIALNIYLGKSKCNERRWKSVFYAKALATILFGLGDLIVGLLTINALRADRRQQVIRDAGHWCGVAIQIALISLTLVSVASMIFNMFAFLHA
jgi:hypothetical protein